MFAAATFHRAARAIAAGASALLLTGCLLSPGAFTSQLDLRKDGTFAYSYDPAGNRLKIVLAAGA